MNSKFGIQKRPLSVSFWNCKIFTLNLSSFLQEQNWNQMQNMLSKSWILELSLLNATTTLNIFWYYIKKLYLYLLVMCNGVNECLFWRGEKKLIPTLLMTVIALQMDKLPVFILESYFIIEYIYLFKSKMFIRFWIRHK